VRRGTVGADYNVLYNKNSVLSISVHIETMGAYPDDALQRCKSESELQAKEF
jgi:hypothetical protein